MSTAMPGTSRKRTTAEPEPEEQAAGTSSSTPQHATSKRRRVNDAPTTPQKRSHHLQHYGFDPKAKPFNVHKVPYGRAWALGLNDRGGQAKARGSSNKSVTDRAKRAAARAAASAPASPATASGSNSTVRRVNSHYFFSTAVSSLANNRAQAVATVIDYKLYVAPRQQDRLKFINDGTLPPGVFKQVGIRYAEYSVLDMLWANKNYVPKLLDACTGEQDVSQRRKDALLGVLGKLASVLTDVGLGVRSEYVAEKREAFDFENQADVVDLWLKPLMGHDAAACMSYDTRKLAQYMYKCPSGYLRLALGQVSGRVNLRVPPYDDDADDGAHRRSARVNNLRYVRCDPVMNVDAHRLIAWMLCKKDPGKTEVHHSCGNPRCLNPFHLEWVSRKEHCIHHRLTVNKREERGVKIKQALHKRFNAMVHGESSRQAQARLGNKKR